jgi:hypothetical protein
MSALRVGATVTDVPGLDGRWSVWSQAGEIPSGYFLAPSDQEACAVGVKYAVIRAINARASAHPVIELIRTDPPRPDLVETAERIAKERKQQRSTTR